MREALVRLIPRLVEQPRPLSLRLLLDPVVPVREIQFVLSTQNNNDTSKLQYRDVTSPAHGLMPSFLKGHLVAYSLLKPVLAEFSVLTM